MFNVICTYTDEDAIEDGIKVRLSKNLTCTTNAACTIAPDDNDPGFDMVALWQSIIPYLNRRAEGDHFDSDATNYPEEADAYLSTYTINEHTVWIMQDYPGSDNLTVMLPEDH